MRTNVQLPQMIASQGDIVRVANELLKSARIRR